ncbi:hypothetical protein IIA15_06745 [candidate division TA06 bacterium]|nr:hypothetical protein [candidate division TA06 bacterium]
MKNSCKRIGWQSVTYAPKLRRRSAGPVGRRRLPLLLETATLLFIILSGCGKNPMVFRMVSNYVPIETIGNRWVYLQGDGTTKIVEVTGTAVVGGRSCFVVEDNSNVEDEFWWKGPEGVDRYVVETRFVNNQEFEIEKRWRPHLELPLVLGNQWVNNFENETIVFGDTICREVMLEGVVDSIVTVTVPAGTFEECYKVRINVLEITCSPFEGDTCNVSCDTLRVQSYETYAPDVGLVMREEIGGTFVEELQTFEVK